MRKLFKIAFIGGAILGFILFMVLVVSLMIGPSVPESSVIHIVFDGELTESPQPSLAEAFGAKPAPTLLEVTSTLRHAADDEDVEGVVLEVKQPELSVAHLQEIEAAMAVFRESGKWSLSFLETAGVLSRGDGTYALAACADRITLAPPGDINLIGIRADVPFFKGTFDKLAIEPHFDKRHKYKNAPNTFTETAFTEEHKEALGTLIEDLQTHLIAHVAARREIEVDVAETWIAGGPYLADAAKEKGLVDELGYWDSVVDTVEAKVGDEDVLISLGKYRSAASWAADGPSVAVIFGEGSIMRGKSEDDPVSGGTMGSDTLTKAFRDARADEVEGVLFRVNSPGGSYIASDLIRREVELTQKAGIPVVVSMGSLAASGGYFVSMGADRIVAQPGTITGSIGVYAGSMATRTFWERFAGITFDSYQTAPHADFFSWLDTPNKERRAILSGFLDRIYDDFVSKAAEGRKKTAEEIHAVAQGRVWSGTAALEHGLVDALGGLHTAADELKSLAGWDGDAHLRVTVYPRPKTTFELLRDLFETRAQAPRSVQRMLSLVQSLERGDVLMGVTFDPNLL